MQRAVVSFIYHGCHCGLANKTACVQFTEGMDFKMSAMKLPELSSTGIPYKFSLSPHLQLQEMFKLSKNSNFHTLSLY